MSFQAPRTILVSSMTVFCWIWRGLKGHGCCSVPRARFYSGAIGASTVCLRSTEESGTIIVSVLSLSHFCPSSDSVPAPESSFHHFSHWGHQQGLHRGASSMGKVQRPRASLGVLL